MTKSFKAGDHVKWDTPQGETSGKVVKSLCCEGRTSFQYSQLLTVFHQHARQPASSSPADQDSV